ncbi:hypothetical protein [Corynebacterium halotolerans]|uniref:hypothetical protein n=1 Tax=Corynebacterium halotolerans TaxID=225326 RepID=UPI003CF19D4B
MPVDNTIECAALLEAADRLSAYEMRQERVKEAKTQAVQRIVAQLTARGVELNQFMRACEVVDHLDMVGLNYDAMSLGVFDALRADGAL